MSGQGTKDAGTRKSEDTVASFGNWLGWAFMLVLVVSTAVHAVALVMARTNTSLTSGADALFQLAGVVVVEGLALATAIKFMTHRIRSEQKPAGIALELTWLGFAALNLISSFATQANDSLALADVWVTYGLPISGLVVAAEYYMIHRLDPQGKREDEMAELEEALVETQHSAKKEVLESEAFKAAMRQAAWQTIPYEVGRRMGLNEHQIRNLIAHAPKLVTATEQQPLSLPAPDTAGNYGRADGMDLDDLIEELALERAQELMAAANETPEEEAERVNGANFTNGRPHGRE